ncbi:MAG: hypothetical protein EOO92_11060 [Pedobacter sp.]|nr:MAG: hypothetical protein EOO92_11060 [Pedobacter sp.]
MNFLSHFYFERDNPDVNMILGVVLPDFIKNADKGCNLYPLRDRQLFDLYEDQLSILKGWERHVKVDSLFHNSDFFVTQTNALKQLLLPIMGNSPVKPFFLAHIGLELLLDHMLTVNADVNIDSFYQALDTVEKSVLEEFLRNCSLQDTSVFFKFFEGFISSKYLFSYQKIENISYALNRICMRIWANPFSENQLMLLTEKLTLFKEGLKYNYTSIFTQIELRLK